MTTKYARSASAISEIINKVAQHIEDLWGYLLDWDSEGIVSPAALQEYANALTDFGAPGNSIFGCIDCTIRQTCRPSIDESMAYTGYKKFHGMKFQAIALPNGLIGHLSGPYRAPQNDAGVLAESKLLEKLAAYAVQPGSHEGDPVWQRYFQVYGDSAYGVSPHILSPFARVGEMTPEEEEWNSAMGSVRISVEHAFGLVLQDWPYLNAFWKQKIFGNACGLFYRVAVILTNAHSCLVPNQTAQRFGCSPPDLHEYFTRR